MVAPRHSTPAPTSRADSLVIEVSPQIATTTTAPTAVARRCGQLVATVLVASATSVSPAAAAATPDAAAAILGLLSGGP